MPVSATSMVTWPGRCWRVRIVITRGAIAAGGDGFSGIHQDVQQHLLELHRVAGDRRHCIGGYQSDVDAPDEHGGMEQAHGILDQRLHVHRTMLHGLPAKQRAQPADDERGVTGIRRDIGRARRRPRSRPKAVRFSTRRLAACAFARIAVSGWEISWASELVSSPSDVTRSTCARSSRCLRASASARRCRARVRSSPPMSAPCVSEHGDRRDDVPAVERPRRGILITNDAA